MLGSADTFGEPMPNTHRTNVAQCARTSNLAGGGRALARRWLDDRRRPRPRPGVVLGEPPQSVAACLSIVAGGILSRMGTKSRERIYGASIRAAAERAAQAGKEADRLAAVVARVCRACDRPLPKAVGLWCCKPRRRHTNEFDHGMRALSRRQITRLLNALELACWPFGR